MVRVWTPQRDEVTADGTLRGVVTHASTGEELRFTDEEQLLAALRAHLRGDP